MHQPDSAAARQILVVAGSGRSGTSLFTGLTGRLGLHIPKPEVSANKSNPRGFGEPRWAVDFHNELLAAADVVVEDGRPEAWEMTAKALTPANKATLRAWLEEQFAESPRIVVKDPRLAWFYELYREVSSDLGADLRVATMLRDPAEVMRSREIAYGTKTTNTTRLVGWLNMMLGIEQLTRDLPRAVVRYDDLLTDWQRALHSADDQLEIGLFAQASEEQVSDADGLVDQNLRRSVVDWEELGFGLRTGELARRVYDAYGRLVDVAAADQGAVRSELDDLHQEFVAYYDESYEVARTRTGATVRRERRKAVRKVREEMAAAAPTGVLARLRNRKESQA